MTIGKFIPSFVLSPFIREFIVIESSLKTLSTVIPDTSIAMAFRYKGEILKMEGVDSSSIPSAVISGLRRSPRHFCYTNDTANLVVIFKEGGITAFSKMPAHEIYGLSVSATGLFAMGTLNTLVDGLSEASDNCGRIQLIEALGSSPKQYGSIIRLRQLIKKYPSCSSLTDACYQAGYFDKSHFIKDFRLFTGQTPKDFFQSPQSW